MSLAAQLWLGYLAAHPGWLITVAIIAALFIGWTIVDSLVEEKPSPRAVSLTSPPAEAVPLFPAGDVPGPASMRSPGADGSSPSSAVLAPGPGTRNGPPWEPIVHEPLAAPTEDLWSKQPAIPGGQR